MAAVTVPVEFRWDQQTVGVETEIGTATRPCAYNMRLRLVSPTITTQQNAFIANTVAM
jgi:hypothetical protein